MQIQTKCGDLVAFTSGGENPHAVMPTLAGTRLNVQTRWAPKQSPFRGCMYAMELNMGITDICSGRDRSACIVGSGECARFVRYDCTHDGTRRRCMIRTKPYSRTESLYLYGEHTTHECIKACRFRKDCKSIAFCHDGDRGNCVLYYHNDDDDDDDETSLPWTPAVMDYFVESMAGFVCYALDCFE